MITVYGGWPTRSVRVAWTLEELGMEYRLRPVNLMQRKQDIEFMGVSPAGFVPVMDDHGVIMVESIAIMQYLLARYGDEKLAPAADDLQFPKYQQFLHLGESSLAAFLSVVVASRLFAPETERENWGANIARELFFNRMTLVDQQLASAPYMAGDDFTAADISVAYALDVGDRLGLAARYSPAVADYRNRVSSRPAYKAMEARSRPPSPAT